VGVNFNQDILSRNTTIVLGDDAEQFFKTDIGRYVVGVANQEIQDGYVQLEEADPEDSKLIRKVQNKIAQARLAILWLNEVIAMGRQEQQQIISEE